MHLRIGHQLVKEGEGYDYERDDHLAQIRNRAERGFAAFEIFTHQQDQDSKHNWTKRDGGPILNHSLEPTSALRHSPNVIEGVFDVRKKEDCHQDQPGHSRHAESSRLHVLNEP